MAERAHEPLDDDRQALLDALRRLLHPLATLAVARGLPFQAVDALMRQAFVEAASAAHPGLLPHRRVSRIATVTGLNRREVARLTREPDAAAAPAARSTVDELMAHWLTDRRYRRADGRPRVLPRTGRAPSFESLARAVTRDVHPRSLLDELCRLRLATLDEATDTVTLSRHAVPLGDPRRMLGLLGANVGDHLRAAVENVQGAGDAHFEQALWADGASDETLQWLRLQIRAQWDALLAAIVPDLEQRIEADGQREPAPAQRVRIGLYSYMNDPAPAPPEPPRPARRTRKTPP